MKSIINKGIALTDSDAAVQEKLAQFKLLFQELETARNELRLTIGTLEELIRTGFPDVLISPNRSRRDS